MKKQNFNKILDSIKMLVGILLLVYGFFEQQNQFLMILGGFLIAVSGIEISFGKTGKIKSPSKK
ncbi:MAG: hypothetical protein ABIJ10_05755 [Candidatus Micrarchaeota archaeon]